MCVIFSSLRFSGSLCFIVSTLGKNNAKNHMWTWGSEIVNPLVTIAKSLQHCKESVLFQNIPAPFHQLQRYWGMLSLSTSFFFHLPINTSVTASCGFQKDYKGEKRSSGVCLSKSCIIFPYMVKVETSIFLICYAVPCLPHTVAGTVCGNHGNKM